MLSTIAEYLENARQCEWYAERATDQEDRKFLLRKAKDWTKLARERELEHCSLDANCGRLKGTDR